jgi:phosphatidylserine/phosphatidylglycerophosphate/cardiolipin synthase-like enzyme
VPVSNRSAHQAASFTTRDDVFGGPARRPWLRVLCTSRVFYDPRALEPDRPGGVLHAKAVVADEEAVFVTSANLTEAAFDRNVEIGLLVRDRALAGSIVAHFRGLIDRGLLSALPGE